MAYNPFSAIQKQMLMQQEYERQMRQYQNSARLGGFLSDTPEPPPIPEPPKPSLNKKLLLTLKG